MKRDPAEEVVSYETAVNIPEEKKTDFQKESIHLSEESAKVDKFFANALNNPSIDLKKYFTPEDVDKLRMLRINLRYNRLHTTFEIIALQADINLYLPDINNNLEAYCDIPSGITEEDIQRLAEITITILVENQIL